MILLEVDPTLVRPGWPALIVVLLLGSAMVFLYLSMRRQFRKINIPPQVSGEEPAAPSEPTTDRSAE